MDPFYIDQPWSFAKVLSILEHLWVPVVVIGTSGTASMIRRLRANMLDELQKQYVITAKAKGLHPLKALIKYPLRTSLNPFIADIGNFWVRYCLYGLITANNWPYVNISSSKPRYVFSWLLPHISCNANRDWNVSIRFGISLA